jgi:hypothetical protein
MPGISNNPLSNTGYNDLPNNISSTPNRGQGRGRGYMHISPLSPRSSERHLSIEYDESLKSSAKKIANFLQRPEGQNSIKHLSPSNKEEILAHLY